MSTVVERLVNIKSEAVSLEGILAVPEQAPGVVVFAHGSGSGRFSPRNQYVARILREGGIGTLLLDLLETAESDDRRKVFDIELLTDRLILATKWIMADVQTSSLAIGYFGASTGAAAALHAAADLGEAIKAVVSRGGRPDLALEHLHAVTAPTLLIVGELDAPVIEMNDEAFHELQGIKDMIIIPGATHLFEEPGALEKVARLARDWFVTYLVPHEAEQVDE